METFTLAREHMPLLLQGAIKTIEITTYSLFFATILGLIFGLFIISKSKILRLPAKVYVSIIRGTPLYVQLIYFGFAIPMLLNTNFDVKTTAIVVLSLNAGAYLVEIFRAGIESIDKGQTEAGRAIGFSSIQTMRYIILPQAVKRMIPAFLNQFIITLKDTSLLATLGIMELLYTGQTIIAMNFKAFEMLTIIAVMYWIIITVLTVVANKLERRLLK